MEEKSYKTFSHPDDESPVTADENMTTTKDTILNWSKQHKTWTCIIIALICFLLYELLKPNIIIDTIQLYPVPSKDEKAGKL